MRFFVALLLRMTSKPRLPDGYELVGFSTVACLNLNVAGLVRGKRARARQMRLRTVSVRTKRTSQYVEILTEASTAADGVLWRERSDFYRFGYATLGFTSLTSMTKVCRVCSNSGAISSDLR